MRVLGPDVLAPYTVGGSRFTAEDGEALAAAFAAFPTDPAPVLATEPSVPVMRDWATARLLHGLSTGQAVDPVADQDLPGDAVWVGWTGRDRPWPEWGGFLTQLAPLACPGLDSPIHDQARRRSLDTARGLTRAVLRRDHLSAARLIRWLTAATITSTTDAGPAATVLAPEPVLRHLEVLGDADPLLHLEIAMARATTTPAAPTIARMSRYDH
jgi:hypothetical protein